MAARGGGRKETLYGSTFGEQHTILDLKSTYIYTYIYIYSTHQGRLSRGYQNTLDKEEELEKYL